MCRSWTSTPSTTPLYYLGLSPVTAPLLPVIHLNSRQILHYSSGPLRPPRLVATVSFSDPTVSTQTVPIPNVSSQERPDPSPLLFVPTPWSSTRHTETWTSQTPRSPIRSSPSTYDITTPLLSFIQTLCLDEIST